MNDREKYIDILKVIGLLCIILAHVNPPKILFQLRNFDVILMILISSYLGIKSKKYGKNYIIKRFYRLVIPTWIFLTLFFVVSFFTNIYDVSIKNMIGSYALSDFGIGYVWVIRIYFIVAICICVINKLINKNNKMCKLITIISIILFCIYEIICCLGFFNNIILQYLFAYFPPCILLIMISNRMFNSDKENKIITILSLVIFTICLSILYKINGKIIATQEYKYPFRVYYISYGVFVSGILIMIFKKIKYGKILNNKLFEFISSNSLWIYLWHIFILYCIKPINMTWSLKFILIISISLIIVFIQSMIIRKLNGKINENILKIFKG